MTDSSAPTLDSHANHSPLPWRTTDADNVADAHGTSIAICAAFAEMHENAAFIVEACNQHDALIQQRDALLAALNGILEIGKRDMSNAKYDGYFESARAAIAKAEGR